MTHGVVHPSLVPFLWPNTADWPDTNPVDVHGFWAEAVTRGHLQRNSLEVVRTGRDLMRVILLLEGLDIAAFLLKRGQSMASDRGDHSGGVAKFDAGGGMFWVAGLWRRTARRGSLLSLRCCRRVIVFG